MKKFLIGGIILVMALAIPVTLTLVSRQQNIRQQAQEATCSSYMQQYFNNLSTQPNTGSQLWQQYKNQLSEGNCPSLYLLPSAPPKPSISVSVTRNGRDFQQGSYLCTYYQNILTRLQNLGLCAQRPEICDRLTTLLQRFSCSSPATPTSSPATPTPSPAVSISPTDGANPTITPVNPPIYDALADLNDDGKIDELDLNILYSGFSKRKGD